MIKVIEITLNRKRVRIQADDERMLLWVLRSDLGLTGTKCGCGEGRCGACTVLVNGKPARSCQTALREVAGKRVLTIEGLEVNQKLHPLQKAFIAHDAFQCGFCTPGMIMSAFGLLLQQPSPAEADIIRGMDDNLCRCASYGRIVKAIQTAAAEMKGGRR